MKDYSGWVNRSIFPGSAYDKLYKEIEKFQFEFCGANRNYKNGWFYQNGTRLYGCDLIANWSRQFECPYVGANIGFEKSLDILDVGSGFGFLPFWLSSKGHNVTCTDILKLDELYCEGKVRFLKNDITRNALDEKYDVIYSISVIEHIENKYAAINNILKMLRTGGKLILTMDVDLSLKAEGTIPNYGEIAKLIHLLNGKLGKSLEEFSFDRRDLVTVSMYQHEKWRLPWRDPYCVRVGLKDLIKFILSKGRICKEQIPEIGVFCGIWEGK